MGAAEIAALRAGGHAYAAAAAEGLVRLHDIVAPGGKIIYAPPRIFS